MVVLLATLGIVASLLAYAVSPTVRHAVGHAAHSVKSTVGNVLDRDKNEREHAKHPAKAQPTRPAPAQKRKASGSTAPTRSSTVGASAY